MFPAKTLIVMADGTERPIEEVGIGNQVLGLEGLPHSVLQVEESFYTGNSYSILVRGWPYPLIATEDQCLGLIPNLSHRAKFGAFESGSLVWEPVKSLIKGKFIL